MKVPQSSRYAAFIIGLMTIGHGIVALDLAFNFFPSSPEITELWAAATWVKALWFVVTALGIASGGALLRAPMVGFLIATVLVVSLYFAADGLWHELKGTFWIVLGAAALAGSGALSHRRTNRSFKPTSLGDAS